MNEARPHWSGAGQMLGRTMTRTSSAPDARQGCDSFHTKLGDEMRGERATLGKSLLDVQRELRIRASYIAAIENADLSAFDSLSFVAGYVRSYARYLDMDPEVVFARFREESGFGGVSALKPMESEASRREAVLARKPARKARGLDPVLGAGGPFANKAAPAFAGFEPGALGSLAVLAALALGLGYGGWAIVQEIQRVQVAPVEESPALVAELDPLAPAAPEAATDDAEAGIARPSQDALAQLYRPQALEAPILTARDAPISTIAPGAFGALASAAPSRLEAPDAGGAGIAASIDAALSEALGVAAADPGLIGPRPAPDGEAAATPQVLAAAPDAVVLVAVRPAWVRVRSADGATLFEKTLEPGETWEVPVSDAPATLRTGNSGALYMAVGGQTFGPVAPGAQVVSGIALDAASVQGAYAVADLEADADLARVVAALDAGTEAAGPAAE